MSPGLAWQACLKKPYGHIELELFTDLDMLLMSETEIRCRITQAVHRYAKSNNEHMDDKFNPKEVSSYLLYLDTNNLYGWAMIQKLIISISMRIARMRVIY